jgi:hypothetical protein
MRYVLVLLSLLFSLTSMAQDFDRLTDEENGSVVFKGEFRFEDLKNEDSFNWLQVGAEGYKPDSVALKFLKKHMPAYELVIMLGTWCEDSHLVIPQLYTTLEKSAYPLKYNMYGLDRAKTTKHIEHKLYRVDRVPTVILMQNNLEIGRITEMPKKSIERDLRALIELDLQQQEALR